MFIFTTIMKINKLSHKSVLKKGIYIFHSYLKPFMSERVYVYLAVGGICFFINFMVFHVSFYFIYVKLTNPIIPPSIAAILSSLSFTLPIGFYMNLNFVFFGSKLSKQIQFIRYVISTILGVFASGFLIKFFISDLKWNVTVSFLLNMMIIQTINYFVQMYFSFKK